VAFLFTGQAVGEKWKDKMAWIIEFTGKPGAGKTRACKGLLSNMLISCPERRVKGLFSIGNDAFMPYAKAGVLLYSIGFQYSRFSVIYQRLSGALDGASRRRLLSSLVNAIYLDFRLCNAVRHHDVVMLDQGFLQLCWANLDGENAERIKSLVKNLYEPYAVHDLLLVKIEPSRDIFEAGLKARLDLAGATGYRFDYLDTVGLEDLIDFSLHNVHCCSVELDNDIAGHVNIEPVMFYLNDINLDSKTKIRAS
jgi:hypothetical protein